MVLCVWWFPKGVLNKNIHHTPWRLLLFGTSVIRTPLALQSVVIAEHLSARQLILQRRPISAGVCIYIYIYIYVAILSYAQECNYRLRLTHVKWYNHARVGFCGAHLGTRSRLHTLTQRGQWCGADSALQSKLRSQPTQKEHYYTYISNSSNLCLAIFF